ncbi:hypothetical protein StoSoilA2_20330 [Arthrobacter sp. StoSoilA2]|nr:hypothetical protein StoSoilA2_20330 [Arthrobacter sp. StoSoilA2]
MGRDVPAATGTGFDDAVSDVVNLLVAVLGGRREEIEGLFLGAVALLHDHSACQIDGRPELHRGLQVLGEQVGGNDTQGEP